MIRSRPSGPLALLVVAAIGLAACSDDGTSEASSTDEQVTLRLGYFPNITHAPALVGVEQGPLRRGTGRGRRRSRRRRSTPARRPSRRCSPRRSTRRFIGPNPAINAFAKSDGEAIRIVVRRHVGRRLPGGAARDHERADLTGTKLATPQLGNTQDVALRAWLLEQGLDDRHRRRRRRVDPPAGERRHARRVQCRRHRRRLGARAVGHPPRSRRAAARCSSTSATCGPTASTSRPT